MRYDFQCPKGHGVTEVQCLMVEYDSVKPTMICVECGSQMEPIIYGGFLGFMREGFPKGYEITEHCCDEPVFCKDKAQLKDLCEASGTTSRFLEDDM